MPVLESIDILDAVQLMGRLQVVEKSPPPMGKSGRATAKRPQRGSGQDHVVISICEIVVIHEFNRVIQKAGIHATQQQHLAAPAHKRHRANW